MFIEDYEEEDFTIVGINDEPSDDEEIVSIFEYAKQKKNAPEVKEQEEPENNQQNNDINQIEDSQDDNIFSFVDMESKIQNTDYVSDKIVEDNSSSEIYTALNQYKAAVHERKNKAIERIAHKYDRRKLYMKRRGMLAFTIIAIVFVLVLSVLITHSDAAEGYSIRVNCSQNTVTIYENGNPVKAMVCSTGRATPHSGSYKMDNKYRWLSLVGGVYGQYCTRIVGNILFHSVPYYRNGDPSSLEWDEYDKLGTAASAGCVRLAVEDAKWIYDNVPGGTTVTFYDDSNPGPLGKPISIHLKGLPDYFRCWDPTDPDQNSPWHDFKDPTFDAEYYANTYADLKAAYGNDSAKLRNHWYDLGVDEGRQASPTFSTKFYLSYYADVAKAYGKTNYYKAFEHFLLCGMKEYRASSEEFDVKAYKANYPDLVKAFGNNVNKYFEHFLIFGAKEKRIAMMDKIAYKVVFDPVFYANKYDDLKKAFGDNEKLLFKHFLNFGIKEKRVASSIFDIVYYLEQNPDLVKAFGKDNYMSAFEHFKQCGFNEVRPISENFNLKYYKENYDDLVKAYGNNSKAYYQHYLYCGIKEGRTASKLLDKNEPVDNTVVDNNVNNTINNTNTSNSPVNVTSVNIQNNTNELVYENMVMKN